MRIAYIAQRFPNLSETFITREVLGLRKLGYQIDVFSFRRPTQREWALMSDEWRHLANSVTYVERAATLRGAVKSLFGRGPEIQLNNRLQQQETHPTNRSARLWRAYAISAEIKKRNISHIHAHWPYGSEIAVLVHEMTGIPYSVSIHAHEVAHNNGHFPVIFETLSFASFCNRAAMEFLLNRLPEACRGRAHLVYHGVDLDAFPARPLPPSPPPLQVVSAGRLTRTKGFDRLIRGCARAVEAGIDVELTILGHGSLHDELQQQASELEFTRRLRMPGWVPHTQVIDYLAQSHMFALLADTSYHDGLPNVLLEAMACGRPVILSPLPAAPEVVTDGIEGVVLSKPDDLDGLVAALAALIKNPTNLARMGQAARTRVERQYNDRSQLQNLIQLFRSVQNQDMSQGTGATELV